MSRTIGIFDNQEQAVKAVQALRDGGYAADEIKVVGRDRDAVRFVEADTDVHADELQEIRDARGGEGPGVPGAFVVGAAPLGGGTLSGTGVAPYLGGAYPAVAGGLIDDGDTPFENIFKDFGLGESEAEACRDAVSEGRIVIIADRDDDADGRYVADGPTDAALGEAETLLRANGAVKIL
ncbi:hypothetical protein HGI30_18655 [Paenibacillus albicereus]|uniref:General stress protein 17M-like domain-containing protein n=1 Tax=Paenibacillus albicereus TaxID=2726185 RepID=A0A6H2H1B3_9BACL|nr:general stress protein [Paenibacillus albicereus]QJC53389.1 hypothetical protein HGI30_18655 [Paenibacillus albicereus]